MNQASNSPAQSELQFGLVADFHIDAPDPWLLGWVEADWFQTWLALARGQ